MRSFTNLQTCFFCLIGCLACAVSLAEVNDKPNIILINIDDLGYSDIEPFGGPTRTPRIQQMANEGMKLCSHYAAPLCSPSRAAMMTGCYPKRVLPIPGVLFPASAVGLHPAETTVAEVLKQAGYETACIGKWHLGDQPEFLPTNQGFDSYYGIPYSNDMGLRSEGAKSNPDKPIPPQPKNANPPQKDEAGSRGDGQPPLPLLENNNVIERVKVEQQHTFTQRYTDRAVAFIRKEHSKPFFLYLPHNAVHWPHYPSKQLMGKSGISLQKDWVIEIDQSVGQVFDALREAKLDKNTLVIFTSDNGGPLNQGATNQPLRGAKGSTLEGGMRVCTIAWWPGKIAAGTKSDEITAHMDWLPTFASLAGAKLPDSKLDGIDLYGLLTGKNEARGHQSFFYFSGLALEAVRKGPWKLHLAKNELYHLENDIAEKNDVAEPNAEVVADLKRLVEANESDLGDKGKAAPGIRQLGRVDKPLPLISSDGTVRPGMDGFAKQLP